MFTIIMTLSRFSAAIILLHSGQTDLVSLILPFITLVISPDRRMQLSDYTADVERLVPYPFPQP